MATTMSRHSPSPSSPPPPDINITATSTPSPHHHPHLHDTSTITTAATNITPSYHHHLHLHHHASTTSLSSSPPRCRHHQTTHKGAFGSHHNIRPMVCLVGLIAPRGAFGLDGPRKGVFVYGFKQPNGCLVLGLVAAKRAVWFNH
nr:hypothetical protein [Tanacetum cinerariifolium]